MVRLLLTSTGLANQQIREKFLELAEKDAGDIRVLFIPTASRYKDELVYVEKSKAELVDSGVKKENIIIFDINKPPKEQELTNIDVVYVCGGNTFYLLDKLRKSNFDKTIINLIRKGALYVGVSAGSILPGPTIDIAAPFDENDVALKDTRGLGLTKLIITPHFQRKEKSVIDNFEKENNVQVTRITDSQAALDIDGNVLIMGS